MPDVRIPDFALSNPRIGMTYVDADVNYLADLSIPPVTYNPPAGTGVPRRDGNYRFFRVRVHVIIRLHAIAGIRRVIVRAAFSFK